MTDSIVKDCTVKGSGGGVYNASTGTFTMKGSSEIKNCSVFEIYDATWNGMGGAVYNKGTFTMENGEITGCTTVNETLDAGGVAQDAGTFNMQGGIIWGNKNSVTQKVNSFYQTGSTLNQTGGYIDPKTVITLDQNGGTGGTDSVTVYYGDTAMPKIETLPEFDNNKFKGFFDAQTDGTKYYEATGKDAGVISSESEKMWTNLAETMTLYAQWTGKTYTIAYDANGGTGAPENTPATVDADVTLSFIEPTKENCIFAGWNTQKDGKGEKYEAGATVKNLTKTDGATVTLYAQWKNDYIVTKTETPEGVNMYDGVQSLKSDDGETADMRFFWTIDFNGATKPTKLGAYFFDWTVFDFATADAAKAAEAAGKVKNGPSVQKSNGELNELEDGSIFYGTITNIQKENFDKPYYALPIVNDRLFHVLLHGTVDGTDINK